MTTLGRMNIHLARDGSALGIFTADEVRAGLQSGRFLSSDLAWREGMPNWVALAAWPEFAGAAPAAPGSSSEPDRAPSELPWEIAPGLKSLLKSAWLLVARPSVLASARLRAGGTFAAAYLSVAILLLPMLILGPLAAQTERARMAFLADALVSSGNSEVADIGRGILDGLNRQAEAGALAGMCGAACVSVVYPLLIALMGVLLWPGLRVQGKKVDFGRAITATLFASCLLFLALFPVSFLLSVAGHFAPVATLLPSMVLALVTFGLICRAVGAALSLSGWRIFLSWLLLLTVFCLGCCCCSCLFGLLAGLGK